MPGSWTSTGKDVPLRFLLMMMTRSVPVKLFTTEYVETVLNGTDEMPVVRDACTYTHTDMRLRQADRQGNEQCSRMSSWTTASLRQMNELQDT